MRGNGQRNPPYTSTYVFPNDFPALIPKVPAPPPSDDPLFQMGQASGTCRVMCFHPDSKVTLPLMSVEEIVKVIEEWKNQLNELGRKFTWVQIFENKGAAMGCSNPHPHCQIWATSFLPNEAKIKDRTQKEYYLKNGRPMLEDYLKKELMNKERIVVENSEWVVVVPFWAIWPYETLLLPRKSSTQRLTELDEHQTKECADIIKKLTTIYDNLFKCRFPYSMGWHGALSGADDAGSAHWTLHAMWLPPLLRGASVRKFLVGFELFAQAQRDLTPEQAAATLRQLPLVHYSLAGQH